ncbi:MAG: hypothetical protein K8L99_02285 [Anaerolineae bacterium]|nr:hypothetical protein [Anaerolineae bacterium]
MTFRYYGLLILAIILLYPGPTWADAVVGDGTPESCTTATLVTALTSGGIITFNCGGSITIILEETLQVASTTTIDGGGLVTLSGDGVRRVLEHTGGTLTLQNLSIINGLASGIDTEANGAGIHSAFQGTPLALNIDTVTFSGNISTLTSYTGSAYDYGGGAIYAQGMPVSITSSTFSGNAATNGAGGALHGLRSDTTITDSTFDNNTALGDGQGGALYFDGAKLSNGIINVNGSTFTNNSTHHQGGAIYVHLYQGNDAFTVNQSTFMNNSVVGGISGLGGAISGGNGDVIITNSLFAYNAVDLPGDDDGSGGAVAFAENADILIGNTTFYANRAEGMSVNANGGAIYIVNNSLQFRITNATIAGNYAGWVGGGIASSGNGILRNTIIANNTADNGPNNWMIQQQCSSQLLNGGSNLQYPARSTNLPNDTDCANSVTIAEPMLDALNSYGGPTQTLALELGSPAIDTGNNSTCAAFPIDNKDQRGLTRPKDGNGNGIATCDIGAYEYHPDIPPFTPVLQTPSHTMSTMETTTNFSWIGAPFADSYRLQVDDNADFSSPIINFGITGTAFTPDFLLPGLYHWRVIAINDNGQTNSPVHDFTLVSPPEAAPVQYLFDVAAPTLSWLGREWAGGYHVQIATDADFAALVYDNDAIGAANTSVIPNPLKDGIYYWRVRMLRPNSRWSDWSPVQSFGVMVGISSP